MQYKTQDEATYSQKTVKLYDAHNHLQDSRLDPWRAEVMETLGFLEPYGSVVNGTAEADWPRVAGLADAYPWVKPSFGLHPWHVKKRSKDWADKLRYWLLRFPKAAVGEVGLDRWIQDPDVPAQVECFRTQLKLAAELDRAVTVHCLRAWGLVEEELRKGPFLSRGFLLHSYGGPQEMIPGFVKQRAYFSLSPYFAHPRKEAQLAVFKAVPLDRLLAETDAPEMWPPESLNENLLGTTDQPLNHPANIRLSYDLLAKLRGIPIEDLAHQLNENACRLFG